MARFRYKHIQSTVEDKKPLDLLDGELAVNRFKGKEKIFLKNASGDVVSFSSDSVIDALVGSGFTSSSITDVIIENERVVSNALTDLDERKLDASAYTPTDLSNYYTKDETSGKTELTTAFNSKASQSTVDTLSGTVTSHTANADIHVTSADKTTWNAKVDASAIADFFDDAKYEDSGTTKVINFYHGNTIKATIDASDFIVDGMVDDVKIENGYLVIDFNTASGKQDISIPLTNIFDPSNYYDKDDIDDLVGSGFTSSSITDVIIENEEIVSNALTDLDERKLDASAYTPTDLTNYYTKSETSGATELTTAFGEKADTATTLAGYGITDAYTKSETSGATEISTALEGKVNTSDIISAITPSNSGSTNPIATSVVAENELTVSNALIDLDERKLDASAYTPVDLSNYYTKSETSGATEISTALAGKVDTATFTGHTADTTVHHTSTSAVTSGSTDVITSGGVYAQLDGIKLKKITQSDYDQLQTKDPNTLYIITD